MSYPIERRFVINDQSAFQAALERMDQLSPEEFGVLLAYHLDQQRCPALEKAVSEGDVEKVREILSYNQVQDLAKSKSLIWIAESSLDPTIQLELVQLFINAGTIELAKFKAANIIRQKYESEKNLSIKAKYILIYQLLSGKRSALWTAVRVQDIASIRLLFADTKSNLSLKDMGNVLRSAVESRSVEIVREFVNAGIYPDLGNNESEEMNIFVLKSILHEGPIATHEDELKILLRRSSDYGKKLILAFLQNEVNREMCEQLALLGIKSGVFYLKTLFPDDSYQVKLPVMPEDLSIALQTGDITTLQQLLNNKIDDFIKYKGMLLVVNSTLDNFMKFELINLIVDSNVSLDAKKEVAQIVKQKYQEAQDKEEKDDLELILLTLDPDSVKE